MNPILNAEQFQRAVSSFDTAVEQLALQQRWFSEAVDRLEATQRAFSGDIDRLAALLAKMKENPDAR